MEFLDKRQLLALMTASIYGARTTGNEQGILVTEAAERAVLDAEFIYEEILRKVNA